MIGISTGIWSGLTARLRSSVVSVGDTLEILGLTAQQAQDATYQWFLGGSAIAGSSGPSYIATTPGQVSAMVTLEGVDHVTAPAQVEPAEQTGTAPLISLTEWDQPTAVAGQEFSAHVTASGTPAPTAAISAVMLNGSDAMAYASGSSLTFPVTTPDGAMIEAVQVTATNASGSDTAALPDTALFNNDMPDLSPTAVRAMTPEASAFPLARQIVFYGDSIVAGGGQQFADMVMSLSGHKVFNRYLAGASGANFASGGQPVEHVSTTQIGNMQNVYGANVPGVAVIKIGTNGAGPSYPDNSAASLIAAMTQAISDMEAAGHTTIFLCNEIPSRGNVWAVSPQAFYDYHLWLQSTAPGLATTSTIIPVDTWTACGDPRYLTDVAHYALHPDCRDTGGTDTTHPGSWGHERMALAVAKAIDAEFATTITDFTVADINRMDGALATFNGGIEGPMPNGWNDAYINTPGLTYAVAGTGLDTTFTVTNTTDAPISGKVIRGAIGGSSVTLANAYLTIAYEVPDRPDAAGVWDGANRDFGLRVSLSGTTNGVLMGGAKSASDGDLNGAQPQRMGGMRWLSVDCGDVTSGALVFTLDLPAGGWITFHELTLRSGA